MPRTFMVAMVCAAVIGSTLITPARGAETFKMDALALGDRAAGLALSGDVSGARRAAARIDRPDRRDQAFARIAVILSRTGKERDALVVLARITNLGRRDDTMAAMGVALARRGKFGEARKLAGHLDPGRRDRIRAAIALAHAERGKVREGWRTARRSRDLPRRRAAMTAFRSGLAKTLAANAAIGVALGADTLSGRVVSLIAVARRFAREQRLTDSLLALAWARQMAEKPRVGKALRNRVASDTAMILLNAGDFEGARLSAGRVRDKSVRQFLLRYIDDTALLDG